MARRRFSWEFKLEAVRLVEDQGISVAQAARDLDLHENVLRKWVRLYRADPVNAFPGAGQQKPEQAEVAALKREIKKLKAERDILKNVWSAPGMQGSNQADWQQNVCVNVSGLFAVRNHTWP